MCPALPLQVSVLSTTVAAKEGVRDALKFRLQGSKDALEIWGHEYMRHLAGGCCVDLCVCCRTGVGVLLYLYLQDRRGLGVGV